MRSAYRRRGWGFTDPQQISQCAKEGFVEKLKAQEGEGCHMWGTPGRQQGTLLAYLCPGNSLPAGLPHGLLHQQTREVHASRYTAACSAGYLTQEANVLPQHGFNACSLRCPVLRLDIKSLD